MLSSHHQYLITFAKDVSSFTVTENDPLDVDVLDHRWADLPGKSALCHLVAILCSNMNVCWNSLANLGQVNAGHTDDNL